MDNIMFMNMCFSNEKIYYNYPPYLFSTLYLLSRVSSAASGNCQ